ncbi:TIGR03757 family integrating conjugative element protein [Sodalis ligni]|uniref:Integrating conjugative element protein (TIGR03757 family) n=1 Tax=Sodalis ligni TaxID=2697027 RepID=A0A4R1N6K9_9GAMM|nr:TIGR03757 family integrating conjugative element protein [Sodalis ligni]TCL02177.1 integrating conjugative element protein (TIGR03757 family) [Sodalis ligni]
MRPNFVSLSFLQLSLFTAAAEVLLMTGAAHAMQVLVVTDSRHPVTGKADRIIELDAPALLENNLSSQLPASPNDAEKLLKKRLNDGGNDLQLQFSAAWQGVTNAWSVGIKKIPAVVVDSRYVIYGESDIDHAVARIQAYRNRQL